MRLKYIEGMTFREIANQLGYCERHTIRKHGKILAKIA
jgi:DNA-directed RNA polymerase specialized sigma subunit